MFRKIVLGGLLSSIYYIHYNSKQSKVCETFGGRYFRGITDELLKESFKYDGKSKIREVNEFLSKFKDINGFLAENERWKVGILIDSDIDRRYYRDDYLEKLRNDDVIVAHGEKYVYRLRNLGYCATYFDISTSEDFNNSSYHEPSWLDRFEDIFWPLDYKLVDPVKCFLYQLNQRYFSQCLLRQIFQPNSICLVNCRNINEEQIREITTHLRGHPLIKLILLINDHQVAAKILDYKYQIINQSQILGKE